MAEICWCSPDAKRKLWWWFQPSTSIRDKHPHFHETWRQVEQALLPDESLLLVLNEFWRILAGAVRLDCLTVKGRDILAELPEISIPLLLPCFTVGVFVIFCFIRHKQFVGAQVFMGWWMCGHNTLLGLCNEHPPNTRHEIEVSHLTIRWSRK